MAWETGTATSHIDLVNKLVTFLTTNSALVAASQAWTALRTSVSLPFSASVPAGRFSFGNNIYPSTFADPWPNGVANANTRMKITGNLSCPTTGSYQFVVLQGDWCEIRIDGTLVYGSYSENYQSNYPSTPNFTTTLSSGSHTIDVRLIGVNASNRGIAIGWKKPGDSSFDTIPAGNLSSLALAWNLNYGSGTGNTTAFANMMNDVEVALKGPGLSGTDEVFVFLNTISNTSADYFNIRVNGGVSYIATNPVTDQPGIVDTPTGMLCWNSSIKYWFIANGRHFKIIAKVSTSYENLYAGFLLPYGLPSEVPYPMTIGASSSELNIRFSESSLAHSSFWRPSSNTSSPRNATLKYRDNAGQWTGFSNVNGNSFSPGRVYPTNNTNPVNMRNDPTGSYALIPATLYIPLTDVVGELDGVFYIPGFSNASENIVTIASQDYLVVQAANRATGADYVAIKLA